MITIIKIKLIKKIQNEILVKYNSYCKLDNNKVKLIIPNNEYVDLYNECIKIYSTLLQDFGYSASNVKLIEKDQKIDVKEATFNLVALQDEIMMVSANNISRSQLGDDDTSEEETADQGHEESKLYFRSPYGMSALFSPMLALHQYLKNKPIIYEFDQYVYFELIACWPTDLNDKYFINGNKISSNTNDNNRVYYIDANPCMGSKNEIISPSYFKDTLQKLVNRKYNIPTILIVDTTSTTSEQLNNILDAFDGQDKIPLLVTATSVLKHNELGLDAYSVGENKVYVSKKTMDKNQLDFSYHVYIEFLKNATRGTESGFSRKMRRALRKAINSVADSENSLFYNPDNNQEKTERFVDLLLANVEQAQINMNDKQFIDMLHDFSIDNNEPTIHDLLGIYHAVFPDAFDVEFQKLISTDLYKMLTKSDFVAKGYMILSDKMDCQFISKKLF